MNNDKKEIEEKKICYIEIALSFLSRKWSFEIIRDLFFGKTRFKDFLDEHEHKEPKLHSKVLSERLKELTQSGIVEKKVVNEFPVTIEYHLTKLGRSLNKVLYELAAFSINNSNECVHVPKNMTKKNKETTLKFLRKALDIKE